MTKGSIIQTGAPPLTIAERIRANREKRERVAIGINGGRLVIAADGQRAAALSDEPVKVPRMSERFARREVR